MRSSFCQNGQVYQSEEDCMYWHLDKSEDEILGNSDNGKEKRFIMVLKGDGTAYQEINEEQSKYVFRPFRGWQKLFDQSY